MLLRKAFTQLTTSTREPERLWLEEPLWSVRTKRQISHISQPLITIKWCADCVHSWPRAAGAREQFALGVWGVEGRRRPDVVLWLLSACGHHSMARRTVGGAGDTGQRWRWENLFQPNRFKVECVNIWSIAAAIYNVWQLGSKYQLISKITFEELYSKTLLIHLDGRLLFLSWPTHFANIQSINHFKFASCLSRNSNCDIKQQYCWSELQS